MATRIASLRKCINLLLKQVVPNYVQRKEISKSACSLHHCAHTDYEDNTDVEEEKACYLFDELPLLFVDPDEKPGRKYFVGGNWKMQVTKSKIDEILSWLNTEPINPDVEVVVGVPSLYVEYVKNKLPDEISVCAQNCWKENQGSLTGEISPLMLVDVGCPWVILGHSERRNVFKEDDNLIAEKVVRALEYGLAVIFCCGETLEERQKGNAEAVLAHQLNALVKRVNQWEKMVVAYEPVWAIGTGKPSTPTQAQSMHVHIRKWFKENISPEVAESIRIIYGGSVTATTSRALITQPDIDGFLVGKASIREEFLEIVNSMALKSCSPSPC